MIKRILYPAFVLLFVFLLAFFGANQFSSILADDYSHLPNLEKLDSDSQVFVREDGEWRLVRYADLGRHTEFFFQGTLISVASGAFVAKPEITMYDVENAIKIFSESSWTAPNYDDVVYVVKSQHQWQEKQHYKLEDVKPGGDLIYQGVYYKYSYSEDDPEYVELVPTGTTVSEISKLLRSTHVDDMINLTVEFECGARGSVVGSDNHPFFVKDHSKYIPMGDLAPGMQLQSTDGSTAKVVSLEKLLGTYKTYNFAVDPNSNYFVSTDAEGTPGLLVHNSRNCREDVPDPKRKINGETIKNSRYAGQTVETAGGPVTFDAHGFPDFTPYSKATIRVGPGLTGKNPHDSNLAMKKAGMTSFDKENYVWHHHQDGLTMMLVPKNVHSTRQGGVAHTGGNAVIRHNKENPYDQIFYDSPTEIYP